MIVCDRPNPITGDHVAGNVLEPEQASFVGEFAVPTRHAMTLGELAKLFNEHFGLAADVDIIKMDGWERHQWHDQADAPWVMPSPNIPTLTRPFELVGAPYIDPEEYARRLNERELAGVYFRSCIFRPTFQKHAGISCGGVQIHVLDREKFEPVITGITMVKIAYDLYPDEFRWKKPPYEYVYDRNPFDVIAGTSKIREAMEAGRSIESLEESWREELDAFGRVRENYLLY